MNHRLARLKLAAVGKGTKATTEDAVRDRIMAWGPAAVWAAVLFFLGSLPGGAGASFPGSDKLGHLAIYAVLGAALARGWRRAPSSPPHLVLILLGVAYGLLDEVHQAYVPGRDPSGWDVLADTVGVALGYVLLLTYERRAGSGPADEPSQIRRDTT